MRRSHLSTARRAGLAAMSAALVAAATLAAGAAPTAGRPPVAATAFGMHFFGLGTRPFPRLPFGSARIWDMGVTWADLQPTPTDQIDDANPAVQRLDAIVHGFQARHVRPLLVLGMTPSWAVDPNCRPPAPWSQQTCGPFVVAGQSPAWSSYVLALATRYSNIDFEVWNEPNLRNGWNDTLDKLAALQHLAYSAIHAAGSGDRLVSPTVAVTAGSPFTWLPAFLHAPGGHDFDVFGIHLYPSDKSARRGYGPEWAAQILGAVRALLRRNGVTAPIWDTEMNVGRYPYRHSTSRTFTGTLGAAMVARAYLLMLSSGVERVYWYAADDRVWGGTWLESANFHALTKAGVAYRVLRNLLVGARPVGCVHAGRAPAIRYTCRFRTASGRSLEALWTTGRTYRLRAPAGTQRVTTVVGASRRTESRPTITVGAAPTYLIGRYGF